MKPLPRDYHAYYFRAYPEEPADYIGTIQWFGDPWPNAELPSPVCHPIGYVESLPPKTRCACCDRTLNTEDISGIGIPGRGGYFYYDLKCWMDLAGSDWQGE